MQIKNISVTNGRATQEISVSLIKSVLGENFDEFPEGTEFQVYEFNIPVALIPTQDGGRMCLAFDAHVPRGFPVGSFEKSEEISVEKFSLLRGIVRI